MGHDGCDPESHEERYRRRLKVMYAQKTHERQVFMQELKQIRRQKEKRLLKLLKDSVGPIWYQALSVPQRTALDTLEFSIYQDLLEGRPIRTAVVMRELGLYPHPNTTDLMNCVYLGRNDPKEMLAQLFLMTFDHSIDGKRAVYNLNARLMLSGILYLGLKNLILLLQERFRPEPQKNVTLPKRKKKIEPPLQSPYLQKMVAALYEPPRKKRQRPPPLPNIDDLNDPYEEEPPIPKPPLPPPPPPPPKKRLPKSYCDKIAGIIRIEPYSSATQVTTQCLTRTSPRRMRGSRLCVTEVKKTYGLGSGLAPKGTRKKKPVAPSTGMWNMQYMINGVYKIHGKTVYVLGSVTVLPSVGELIHGGHKYMAGENINIHCGFRGRPPPSKPDPCDCVKKWQESVFKYVESTKCYCGHYYDYGNEGTFQPDELTFFQKPTKHSNFVFNHQTIYDLDEKKLYIEKEFKKIWDTYSALRVDDGTVKVVDKKKKKRRSSSTCLGPSPQPEDYLKCALRLMRKVNIAARLPDVHLVPELREWMRRRIHGPYTSVQRTQMLRKSRLQWQILQMLAMKGFGHVAPPPDKNFTGHTTWIHKQSLNDKFRTFAKKYKMQLFRSQAFVTNLMWPSMCQAELPDKKFREIYFSYLFGRIEDMQLMHPYSSKESLERKFILAKKRYICPPAGYKPDD